MRSRALWAKAATWLARQRPPVRQQQAQPVAVVALHMHVAIPARAHQLRHPARVIAVGHVALCLQRGVHVRGLQQHHLQAQPLQAAMQPGRQRTGLVSDAPKSARVSFQNLVYRISAGLGAGLEHHRSGAIHHADRGGFDADIQSSKIRHGCPPMPLGARLRPRWTRINMEDSRLRLRVSAWRIPARYANLVCACCPCAMLQRKSAPLPLSGCCPRAISQRQPHVRNQGMLGLQSDTGPYPLAIVFASA